MSRTMRDDSKMFADTGRDRLLEGWDPNRAARTVTYARSALLAPVRATLDEHCDHTNLNAESTRCLGCGMWAHQFVAVTR